MNYLDNNSEIVQANVLKDISVLSINSNGVPLDYAYFNRQSTGSCPMTGTTASTGIIALDTYSYHGMTGNTGYVLAPIDGYYDLKFNSNLSCATGNVEHTFQYMLNDVPTGPTQVLTSAHQSLTGVVSSVYLEAVLPLTAGDSVCAGMKANPTGWVSTFYSPMYSASRVGKKA